MDRPSPRPGPRDGSGALIWPLAGVIVGLIAYLIVLALPGVHNGGTVLSFVVGGAVAGIVVYLWRRRRRR